jgi:hypothetical protein
LNGATDVSAVGVEVRMRKVACLVPGFLWAGIKTWENQWSMYRAMNVEF